MLVKEGMRVINLFVFFLLGFSIENVASSEAQVLD